MAVTDKVIDPKTGQIYQLVDNRWVPVEGPSPGDRAMNYGADLLRNVRQGGTFGWGDEIVGALGALGAGMPGSEAYGQAYERIRSREDRLANQFAQENPKAAFAGQVFGGFGTGGAGRALVGRLLPGAQAAWQSMSPWLRAPVTGAAAGGAAGAGMAQPDERGTGAAAGAALGAGLGIGTQLVAKYGGQLVNKLVDKWFRQPGRARAAQEVRDALVRDGLTIDEAEAMIRAYGDDAMLADLGGRTRMLGAGVTGLSEAPKGEVERFLRARHAAQQPQLVDSLTRITGRSGKIQSDRQVLEAARKAATGDLYERAYQQPIPLTRELSDMLQLDDVRSAYRIGHKFAEREAGKKLPMLAWDDKAQGWANPPTVQEWDWITRGLRDKAERGFRQASKAAGKSFADLRAQMLDIIDKANPTLAEARLAHATGKSLEEAMDAGMKAISAGDDELVGFAFNSLSLPEKEMYRRGVVKAIRDLINRGGTNRDVSKISQLTSPQFQGRMRLIFGDSATDEFQKQLEVLGEKAATKNLYLHQSNTAEKTAIRERLQGAKVADVGQAALRGDVQEAGMLGLKALLSKPGISETEAAEISKFLHTPVGQWQGSLSDMLGQATPSPFWQRRMQGQVPGMAPFLAGQQGGLLPGWLFADQFGGQ